MSRRMTFRFTVPGIPIGQGRSRFRTAGWAYKEREDRTNEAVIADACIRATEEAGVRLPFSPAEGTGFDVTVYACYPIPKRMTKAERRQVAEGTRLPTRKPDIDNIVKAVFDALSGRAWLDDRLVTRVLAEKSYSDEPRLEVAVAWEEEDD